ncbi:MAG: hypothetical protein R2705_18810 [Ilumatobacteraceae bacterium]
MNTALNGRTIAFLVANEGIEQIELTEPWDAVERSGGRPVLIAPAVGKVQAYEHLDAADTSRRPSPWPTPIPPTTRPSSFRVGSPIPTSCGPTQPRCRS